MCSNNWTRMNEITLRLFHHCHISLPRMHLMDHQELLHFIPFTGVRERERDGWGERVERYTHERVQAKAKGKAKERDRLIDQLTGARKIYTLSQDHSPRRPSHVSSVALLSSEFQLQSHQREKQSEANKEEGKIKTKRKGEKEIKKEKRNTIACVSNSWNRAC